VASSPGRGDVRQTGASIALRTTAHAGLGSDSVRSSGDMSARRLMTVPAEMTTRREKKLNALRARAEAVSVKFVNPPRMVKKAGWSKQNIRAAGVMMPRFE